MKKSKFLESYHSKKTYYFLKIVLNIILLLSFYPLVVFPLNFINSEWGKLGIFGWIVFSVFWLSLLILINGVFEIIFARWMKIESNMEVLPSEIFSQKVVIQYDILKGITPCEVGILLYRKSEISILLSIVYKWVNEKYVKILIKDGDRYLRKINKLGENNPDYEKYLFNKLFNGVGGEVVLSKKFLKKYNIKVSEMVVKTLIKKGYIDGKYRYAFMGENKSVKITTPIRKIRLSVGCSFVVLFFLLIFFLILCNFSGFFLFFVAAIIGTIMFFYSNLQNCEFEFQLTDKGKKAVSHIYGYKYYLEHCEEEQINSDLEENELYSKHLPYAIALKLNWKIIDELS